MHVIDNGLRLNTELRTKLHNKIIIAIINCSPQRMKKAVIKKIPSTGTFKAVGRCSADCKNGKYQQIIIKRRGQGTFFKL